MKTLTVKQARFVQEYLVDYNGTQAAIRAGYPAASARQVASENLSKPDIRAAVERGLVAQVWREGAVAGEWCLCGKRTKAR